VEEIGKILPAAFRRYVRASDPRLVEFLAPLWHRVVGPGIAEHSRPVGFEGGTLRVATECTTWAGQLRQMAEDLLRAVNAFLGGRVVRKIRIEYAPQLKVSRSPGKAWQPVRDPHSKDWNVAADLAGLDPEMARILGRSYGKYFARTRGWN
jgi:hypothetical protein